jgi:hypothetical protein
MLSQKFYEKLKAAGKPYHRLAWEAGISPNQLYKITAGIDRPNSDDPRILALCSYLGLPVNEAFEKE